MEDIMIRVYCFYGRDETATSAAPITRSGQSSQFKVYASLTRGHKAKCSTTSRNYIR